MIDLFIAAEQRAAAEEGMARAADHAEREHEGWKAEAYGYIVLFARSNMGRDFLAEEIAPWAAERGCPTPPDKRAWGAIIQRAGRNAVIEQTGLAAKNRLSGNDSTWRPLWRTVHPKESNDGNC